MAGKRGGGKGKAARRQAQIARSTAASAGAADARRAREREASARAAQAGPSAARWRVADDAGGTALVDVVADLLLLDPRTSLRGRGSDQLRTLAAHVADLVAVGALAPSGRELVELVTDDEATRAALAPSFDLDALLGGGPVASDRADRTVRVAEALLERAAAHRAGAVDLHALAAPVGTTRHPRADEVEATVRIAVDGLDVPASPEPAVVTVRDGWVGADPVELFLAAGRGLLDGAAREVGGAALVTWLQRVDREPGDPRFAALATRLPVEPGPLLEQAAARAGSDHPDVAGSAVVELIALRHPIAPPG